MVGLKVALLLCGLAAVSALPQSRREWPDRPSWWPEALPWPPAIPEEWPDRPSWWPESLNWPPQIPEQWPEKPEWWPATVPYPPSLPQEWPDRPQWWPESQPWPPVIPDQWPDRPQWWPESLPWPPTIPDQITWPPAGFDPDKFNYIPSRDNQFHLFTRSNPTTSQVLVHENNGILASSYYSATRKTVILVHDLNGSATDNFNAILVPALLAAADVNVIVVDWSVGAKSHVVLSTFYSVLSGVFTARFSTWLTGQTGGNLENFHLVGVGIGALNVGFIGRRLRGEVGYITALDPSRGPSITNLFPPLRPNIAKYTEVIHADAGVRGYAPPLGHVDFYPNGGSYMPGCGGYSACNRNRAVYYFGESIQTGGFTGVECASHYDALMSRCNGDGRLNLGGLTPKTGSRGVYWVAVNASPPFSQG